MLLWLTLALLTVLALFLLLRPLTRPAKEEPARAAYDLAIYRDQLGELDRDVARGVLGEGEAAAARTEIERRLLASQPKQETTAAGLSPFGLRLAMVATLVTVPALALALYIDLGSPKLADAPLAERQTERKVLAEDGSLDMAKAKAMLEAKLATAPDSLDGWILLARTDGALGDWAGARAAFDKVLKLSARAPEMLEAYGDLLISEAQGEVTPQAETVLKEADAAKPGMFRTRYYLALGKAQRGDIAGAKADWQALLAAAPPNAPWISTVKAVIAEADRALAGGEAPAVPEPAQPPPEMAAMMNLPPAERMNAIRGMVAGLAARLEQEPNDLAGWKKLARSYRVLGEAQKSADAYGKAAALAPDDLDLVVGEADALQATLPENAPVMPQVTELYRQVTARNPDHPQALWFLGLAEKQAGHSAEAEALWQRLLKQLRPDTAEAKEVQQQLAALPK